MYLIYKYILNQKVQLIVILFLFLMTCMYIIWGTDSRNKTLMKMFNLINIGERSGSGVPNIFNTWNDQGWKEPVIEERFDPDRTT